MNSRDTRRRLTIDQGNSSAKVVVWSGNEAEAEMREESLSIESLLPLLDRWEIYGCAYCSVCHTDAKFLETLRRLVDGRLLVLTPSVKLPAEVNYSSRGSLGADRVAAAMGAASLLPGLSVLVVDAGTAVTVDVIDSAGNFMGGNIAPGLRARFKSLRYETEQLPLVDENGSLPPFGTDTVSAIRCGVEGGMVSEIADAYAKAAEIFGCSRMLITGRDGAVLAPLLEKRGLPVASDPYLVGRGLLAIFEYNEFCGEMR